VPIEHDNEAGGYGLVPTAHPAVEPNDDGRYDARVVEKARELGLTPQRLWELDEECSRDQTRWYEEEMEAERAAETRSRPTEVRTPLPPISNANGTCTRATGWRRSPPFDATSLDDGTRLDAEAITARSRAGGIRARNTTPELGIPNGERPRVRRRGRRTRIRARRGVESDKGELSYLAAAA
jgi:hypothetical protein